MSVAEAWTLLDDSDLLCSAEEADAAVGRIADGINREMAGSFPLVLQVMTGASVFAGRLLPLLRFPLELDYIHATRYGNSTSGQQHIAWRVEPSRSVAGRTVLVVDDILDEGITLGAVRDKLLAMGAAELRIAVFCDKELGREKAIRADFVGVHLPNRYVFGFGMDVNGAWRNLPAVYALKEEAAS